jgi:hypothetical protein
VLGRKVQFRISAAPGPQGYPVTLTRSCPSRAQAPGEFYPYWTLAKVNGTCVWEFGQMTNGKTAGTYTVTLTARNRSGTVTQTFTLNVS